MRILILLSLVVLSACAERTAAPRTDVLPSSEAFQRTKQTEKPLSPGATEGRPPVSARERELIEEAVAGLPAEYARDLRAALLDTAEDSRIEVRGSPQRAAAVARVYEERARAIPRPARRPTLPVTIALVTELRVSTAAAEIIRRTDGGEDHDVILVREREVTAGRLEAAVFALLMDRNSNGLIANTARHFAVGNATSPLPLPPNVFNAEAAIRALQGATARPLDGVGTVRAVVIGVPVVTVRKQ